MRLIDADSIREQIENVISDEKKTNRIYGDYCEALNTALDIIDDEPIVDAYTEDDVKNAIKEGHEVGYEMAKAKFERPTGEWIKEGQEEGQVYPTICSNCHRQPPCDDEGYYLTEFCPYCGADMRGGRE